MAKIYVWEPFRKLPEALVEKARRTGSSFSSFTSSLLNLGHVAVEVGADDPVYMSYWPEDKRPDRCSYMLGEDEDDCGPPSHVINLNCFNEQAMIEAWETELVIPYHWRAHNCCTVVRKVMLEGLNKRSFSLTRWLRVNFNAISEPLQSMNAGFVSFVSDQVVWTPVEIRDLSRYLERIHAGVE